MLPEKIRNSNIAGAVCLIGLVTASLLASVTDTDNVRNVNALVNLLFSAGSISFLVALWFYAEAKGYHGIVGVLLFFLYGVGLIVLLFLKDKKKSHKEINEKSLADPEEDKQNAIKKAKHGAYAAFAIGAITFIYSLYAIVTNAQDKLGALLNDPAELAGTIVYFACAVGMLRNSRAAAVTITVFWIISKLYLALMTEDVAIQIIAGVFFLYFFMMAVQGTFNYHRIRKSEDPEYRPAPKWSYWIGAPALVVFVFLTVFGMLTMTDFLPSTEVVDGVTVSTADRQSLVENKVLYEDEEIELFYSFGTLSVLDGGSILTDRAVVSYFLDENDDVAVYELTFDNIENIEIEEVGNFLNDAVYRVNAQEEDGWISIALSTENRGDVHFVEELRAKVAESRNTVALQPDYVEQTDLYNSSLPRMLDESTRLDSVDFSASEYKYFYTLVDITVSEISTELFQFQTEVAQANSLCNDAITLEALNSGVRYIYSYTDSVGDQITDVVITADQCD